MDDRGGHGEHGVQSPVRTVEFMENMEIQGNGKGRGKDRRDSPGSQLN